MRRAMVPSSLEDGSETGSAAAAMRKLNQQQHQRQKHDRGNTTKRCIMQQLSPFLYLILSFTCGYYVGTYNGRSFQKTTIQVQDQQRRTSQIIRIDDLPLTSTSHVDAQGRSITKQQLVEPFALVYNLAGISVTSLLPGQSVMRHVHESMHEFFYILDGQGLVQLDDDNDDVTEQEETRRGIPKNSRNTSVESSLSWRSVSKGSLIYAAEREAHAFHVPENASQPMQMIFFGLTTTNTPT